MNCSCLWPRHFIPGPCLVLIILNSPLNEFILFQNYNAQQQEGNKDMLLCMLSSAHQSCFGRKQNLVVKGIKIDQSY